MGRKAGITLGDVVDAAAAIADRDGLAAASLSAVAEELGIRTPSLYNHVAGLAGLRRQLALHAAGELTVVFSAAIESTAGADILGNVARSYRSFATEHPGLYEALLPAPRPGEDDELYAAMAEPVMLIAEAISAADDDPEDVIHVIRSLRATLHGFVHLEANGGFGMPVDLDRSYEIAIAMMTAGINRQRT